MPFFYNFKKGFTLIETVISVAIFAVIATSAWTSLANIFDVNQTLRSQIAATNLASEQIEIVRNLPYVDVGIVDGVPDGVLIREQQVVRDTYEFTLTTTIRNIDHEADGTLDDVSNTDTSPADNKLVEVEVTCASCGEDFKTVTQTTWVAPLALEETGSNGGLSINVIDAYGRPVQDADVYIENNQGTTSIVISDTTDSNGELKVVDAVPGVGAYEITVSKTGYSSEQTYEIGSVANPVPDKPHANVVSGLVTDISFTIDELSDVEITTKNESCAIRSNVDMTITGNKTIGLNVFKYESDESTDSFGELSLSNMEWDTYSVDITETNTDLLGSNPVLPFDLIPNASQDVELFVAPSDPSAVLFVVVDGSNEELISEALIEVEQGVVRETATTGKGYIEQNDWSGGSGQGSFLDETSYFDDDNSIEVINPIGEIKLDELAGTYDSSGWLESSTFDVGATTTFSAINWLPIDQPSQAGDDAVRFQIATNSTTTEPLTWDYLGPDGTSGSYYTSSGQSISSAHDGDRYVRYKVYLETDDTSYTPNISNVWISFTPECAAVGQAYVSGLSTGNHDITVSKTGYDTEVIEDVTFDDDWQVFEVTLNPS